MTNIRITGTGSITPFHTQKNTAFLENSFLDTQGENIPSENKEIIEKFKAITGIEERKSGKHCWQV